MSKKQIIKCVVFSFCVMAMACIWPLCVFRRTINEDAVAKSDWKVTDKIIEYGEPLEQFFVAQTSRLQYIAFTVETTGEFSKDDVLKFELIDPEGNIFLKQDVLLTEIDSCKYYYVPIKKWLKKGSEYSFRLSVDNSLNGVVRGMYTEVLENSAAACASFWIGIMEIPGETQTRYGYGFPMNIKNTICIWAFFITIGMTVSKMLERVQAKDEKLA